ncbi:MAG: hypothetical protein JWQ71_112 [Pedosphaera sp.]|nr:hypothetical protein [Pedosphaera sp.]
MNDSEKIRAVVARFFQVPETSVTDEFVFPRDRLQGSAARYTFHAALKRMANADLPTAHTANTLAELLYQNTNAEAPAISASKTEANEKADNLEKGFSSEKLLVGVDVEHSDNLPWSGDPWSEPFYLENFTDAEIAYCLRKPEPKVSFCGLWAAKEAALKCCGKIPTFKPKQIEVSHDVSGRPNLRITGWPEQAGSNPPAISISHTGQTAMAICVCLQDTVLPVPLTAAPNQIENPVGKEKHAASASALVWAGFLLALASLGISVFALTYH